MLRADLSIAAICTAEPVMAWMLTPAGANTGGWDVMVEVHTEGRA